MKLYTSSGPNSRVVKMFAIEKEIDLTYEEVNLIAGDNRTDSYLGINPFGVVPSLELPNGEYLNESVAICEYLEEQADFPKLIGDSANKRATQRSWQRRIELLVSENIYNAYRFSVGLEIYKDRVHCIPDAAEDLEKAARKNLMIIDQLIENRTWICGDWFSLSDILLFCALDFGASVGQPIDTGLLNLNVWFATMMTRESVHLSRG